MLKKLSGYMRIFGVISIIGFSIMSIFFSFFVREVPDQSEYKDLLSYSSFFENKFYDFRYNQILDPNKKDKDVVLIDLDDESLQTLGSWPVDRTHWAKMLNNLKAYGTKIVAFDVIFPEEVKTCGAGQEGPDEIFANAIENFQNKDGNKVILAYTTQDGAVAEMYPEDYFPEVPEELFNFMLDSQQADENMSLAKRAIEKHTYPIKKLLAPMPDMGYINMLEDKDGVFRHYPIVSNVDMLFFPSIGLKAFESFVGMSHKINVNTQGTAIMEFEGKDIFINNRGETKVRWLGTYDNFDSVKLHHIVNGDPNDPKLKEKLNGKIAFVGSSATGAHDLRNTPLDAKMPGVFVHMNIVHMLQHQFFYQHLEDSIKYTFIILGIAVIFLLGVMYFNNAILDLITVIVLSAGIYWVDLKYFLPQGYELKLFFTLFSIGASYSWITFLNFNQSNAEKKQIKGAFSSYVAPLIVDEMLDHPDKLKVGGERIDITCMFSDVRDFTSISEKLTPNELAKALNRYMGEMTDIVFATNGTLDKYIGDAIVAFWGAPIDIGDHCTQAVDAAVKMLEALPAINDEFREQGMPEFKIGLGLNSGECNVGNMGSDQIFAYTALGDNMNLGARLESSCKFYGAQILISEYTYDRMDRSKFVTRLIDNVRVKGKTKPVKVYEVLYKGHHLWDRRDLLDKFLEGYQLFLDKKFEEAVKCFDLVLEEVEDKSSERVKEACLHWIANPPQENEDHTITTRTDK
jgi:adenylate cyclase